MSAYTDSKCAADIRVVSARKLCRFKLVSTYVLQGLVSVVGLHAPLPLVIHVGLGNGLDPTFHHGLVQRMSAAPSGVKHATHLADLVNSLLKRGNSVADECPQQVIRN